MNPQNIDQTAPNLPQEQVIFEIKRHPIGILGVYITSAVLLIVLAIVAFGLAPNYLESLSRSQVYSIATVGYFIFLALVLGFVYVFHIVYWGNRWTLSNENLTQVTRTGLFDKQSSHLSLGNIQDVTAEQEGIMPHMFNYGSLRVETAGERSKFIFPLCPNPNYYAQQILETRERFEQGSRVANTGLQTPTGNDPAAYQQALPQQAPNPSYPQPVPTYPLPPQPAPDPTGYNDQPPTGQSL